MTRPARLLLATLFLLAAPALGARQTARSSTLIDSPVLLHDLQVLSADDMQGRLVDSPGGEKARAYVKGKGDWPTLETLQKEKYSEREYPSAMDLNKAARFVLYRQVQGWILEAGGLV